MTLQYHTLPRKVELDPIDLNHAASKDGPRGQSARRSHKPMRPPASPHSSGGPTHLLGAATQETNETHEYFRVLFWFRRML